MANNEELPHANDLPYYVDQMYPHCSDSQGLREPSLVALDSPFNAQNGPKRERSEEEAAAYVAWLLGESLDGGPWTT